MRRWLYIVLRTEDGWWLSLSDRQFGPYGSRNCAVNVAIKAAEAAVRNGRSAEVVVVDHNRRWTEWSCSAKPRPVSMP